MESLSSSLSPVQNPYISIRNNESYILSNKESIYYNGQFVKIDDMIKFAKFKEEKVFRYLKETNQKLINYLNLLSSDVKNLGITVGIIDKIQESKSELEIMVNCLIL